jgi:hypothetical protein
MQQILHVQSNGFHNAFFVLNSVTNYVPGRLTNWLTYQWVNKQADEAINQITNQIIKERKNLPTTRPAN